jgi:hypothetical protein
VADVQISTHITTSTTGITAPLSVNTPTWYGLYVRADGEYVIADLPDYQSKNGYAASQTALIPDNQVEYDDDWTRNDYALVDLLWSTQGSTFTGGSKNVYMAGVSHNAGNICTFHNALLYAGGGGALGAISHVIVSMSATHSNGGGGDGSHQVDAYNTLNISSGIQRSPGIPSRIVTNGIFTADLYISGTDAGCSTQISMMNTDGVETPPASGFRLTTHALTSPFPTVADHDVGEGSDSTYGNSFYHRDIRGDMTVGMVDTVVIPHMPEILLGVATPAFYTWFKTPVSYPLSIFRFKVRTLGFMWDRTVRGESYGYVVP